jgi:AraC-like DNA-binding protein
MAILVSKRMVTSVGAKEALVLNGSAAVNKDWARYYRAGGVEAMHAHFASHVYHRHAHESYSFGVTESGAQAFTCRNERHVSGAGMVMAFNPDDPHDGHSGTAEGFTYRMVHVWPGAFAGPLPLFRVPVLTDPMAAVAIRRLFAAVAGPSSPLERDERLDATVRLLRRRRPATAGPGDLLVPEGVAPRIRSFLHDRAVADVTADDVAAVAGCSRFSAYRAFVSAYGVAPSEYQRQLRVREARRLLAAGVAPADAAAQAGFADQPHLTRWFRRYYGVTPAVYRNVSGSDPRRR